MAELGFSDVPLGETRESKKFEAIPAGVYNAEVAGVQYVPVDHVKCYWKDYDDEIVFEFVITSGPHARRRFWSDVQAIITKDPLCHLRRYLEAILGVKELPDNFTINTDDFDDFLGLPVKIRLSNFYSKAREVDANGVEEVRAATPDQYKEIDVIEDGF